MRHATMAVARHSAAKSGSYSPPETTSQYDA
ncbi:hypothetical protein AGROH133_04324 [Agrobacterium tumefaciens]|nr:hypothetical protein AGROH133_04324 [Agrobacterium tumefaciens]